MINRQSLKAITPIRVTYYLFKYFLLQWQIVLESLKDMMKNQDDSNIPIPPPRLRHRVHGSPDKISFLQIGEAIEQDIQNLCTLVQRDLYSFRHILDFGCGSGRVVRNFQSRSHACQFYGTDIDSALIDWCTRHLPDIAWSVNHYSPPLPFANETFDLIYGISVFTHLDEALQHAWLGELQRVSTQDALIILSVHGEYSASLLEPYLRNEIKAAKFKYFVTGLRGRFKFDGLPDFYQSAYHTKDYINQVWSHYFDIIRYVERGINHHQDAVLMKKKDF